MKAARWTVAKSRKYGGPHEYLVRRDYPATFDRFQSLIRAKGVRESFTLHGRVAFYSYYYARGYRYWIVWPVLNRARRRQAAGSRRKG